MSKDIFASKAACLLHDPPNKAWLLKSHKNHEEEARRIAIGVLGNTCLKEAIEQMERVAKPADILATSVDRWLLGKLVGKEYSLFPVNEIKLKNIFNPKFSLKVDQKEPPTNEFIEALKNLIEAVSEPRLAYHVLYACYEATWIQLGLPAGPADTRSPSHTVFDHNYATASMMNWLLDKEEPEGILLYIDLGGVQRFISSSRKLSDLWISSYLASALAWSILWIFVKALGPDVMILPTCRGNPFYYHSLISELTRSGINEGVIKEIKKISAEFAGYDPDKDKIPRYAVVPATATLILPSLDQLKKLDEFKEIEVEKGSEGLEEFVRKKYQEIWKSIYEKIIETCKDLRNELDNLAIEAERLLKECRKFRFNITPPLPIRVIAIQTNRLHELKLDLGDEANYRLYHNMFKLLGFEEGRRKLYKSRQEEDLLLFEMTSQPIKTWPKEAEKGFEYCSVCGKLPAIIIFSSDEKEYKKHLDIRFEPIFSLGERLCPYCLIKRLLTRGKILKPIIDTLIGELSREEPSHRFISVCDIALMPFKKSLIEKALIMDKVTELAEELSKRMNETCDKVRNELGSERAISLTREEKPILDIEERLLRDIKNLKTMSLKLNLEKLLFLNTETGIMEEMKLRDIWLDLIESVNEDEKMKFYGKPIEELNAYYAIIRGDGDNLGKIIRGKIEEGFRITIKEYLCNVLEGSAGKVVDSIINNDYEQAKKICLENKVKDVDGKLNDISKFIGELQNKNEIIISPSYHSTLSRALMANAIRDEIIINNCDGLTIYAGGDDLLAITPVKNSLNAVRELREKFSFPSPEYKGFEMRCGYLIPSLATASRSFSIYLTHYMFPMYSAISRSAELLKSIAKESKWMIDIKERKKDALIFSYSPRGGERFALLPLSNVKAQDEDLGKSLKCLDELILQIEKEKKFSSSLIYDLYGNIQMIKLLINRNSEALLKRLLERIFERNCEIKDEKLRKEMVEMWARRLIEDYDVSVKVDRYTLLPLEQFFLALMLYRSGLRGVE